MAAFARKREADTDFEPPLTHEERREFRRLLAIGTEKIQYTVQAVEVVASACPTFRREMSDK